MGAEWDGFVPPVAVWDECLRVLKPGGHLLAFAGSRTHDLMTLGIRLAGFEIRDSVAWLYGSGFPKSLDVSKAIDKRGGNAHMAHEIGQALKAARVRRGWTLSQADRHFCGGSTNWTWYEGRKGEARPPAPADFERIVAEWPELAPLAESVAAAEREKVSEGYRVRRDSHVPLAGVSDGQYDITAPATDAARQWEGWGTALKPAFEPVTLARKPLTGTVAANVLEHGTGALNIDGSRIGGPSGRWPANVVLDESQAAELDRQSGTRKSSGVYEGDGSRNEGHRSTSFAGGHRPNAMYSDTGGASRFMYVAKAPKSERPVVDGTAHPTVKPLTLMRWLVRMVTPPGGTVLDPFAGSGTTLEAAMLEGFNVTGIEREADYLPLIRARVERATTTLAAQAEADADTLFPIDGAAS